MRSFPIEPVVSFVAGMCSEMKSHFSKSSSLVSIGSAPRIRMSSGFRKGSAA